MEDFTMKKLLALILAALMIVTLSACAEKGNENTSDLKDYLLKDEIVNHIYFPETGETFYFDQVDSETVTITAYSCGNALHELKIPETLDGKTVVGISVQAFKECNSITKVIIPATVKTIDRYAFANCALISELTIPATVQSIGEGAFTGCSRLTTLDLSATIIKTIPYHAFSNCVALTTLSVPASVESIGDAAFLGCSSLQSITFAEGLTSIGKQAFQNCTALESIKFPASVTEIEDKFVFAGSENLYIDGIDLSACTEESAAYKYVYEIMNLTQKPADPAPEDPAPQDPAPQDPAPQA